MDGMYGPTKQLGAFGRSTLGWSTVFFVLCVYATVAGWAITYTVVLKVAHYNHKSFYHMLSFSFVRSYHKSKI
jgi:SNF family Na+-dependent transporter